MRIGTCLIVASSTSKFVHQWNRKKHSRTDKKVLPSFADNLARPVCLYTAEYIRKDNILGSSP